MRLPDQLSRQAKTVSCDTRGVVDAAETRHNPPDDTQGTQKPPGRGYTERKKSRRFTLLPCPGAVPLRWTDSDIPVLCGSPDMSATARDAPRKTNFRA